MFKDELEKVSYCIGLNVGTSMSQQGVGNLSPEKFAEGVADVLSGGQIKVDPAEVGKIVNDYMVKVQEEKFSKNIEAGKTFLAENKKREGVIELESGLQYEVMTEGDGEMPKETDYVTTHYHGTLIDGTVFDSSVQRNEPASFPVNGVIKGWVEALQLMKTGSKWKLFVPSELAYGANPHPGGPIEPHMVLVFEVELISIQQQ